MSITKLPQNQEEQLYTDFIKTSQLYKSKVLNYPDTIAILSMLQNPKYANNISWIENSGILPYLTSAEQANISLSTLTKALNRIEEALVVEFKDILSFYEKINVDSKNIEIYNVNLTEYFELNAFEKKYLNNVKELRFYIDNIFSRVTYKLGESLRKYNMQYIKSKVYYRAGEKISTLGENKNDYSEEIFSDTFLDFIKMLYKDPDEEKYFKWLRRETVNSRFCTIANYKTIDIATRELKKRVESNLRESKDYSGFEDEEIENKEVENGLELYCWIIENWESFVKTIDNIEIKNYVSKKHKYNDMTLKELAPFLGKNGQGIIPGAVRNKGAKYYQNAAYAYLQKFINTNYNANSK